MNREAGKFVPIPLKQRWHDLRLRILPVLVFAICIWKLTTSWQEVALPPAAKPAADWVQVTSSQAGTLVRIKVGPQQPVKTGEFVATVLVTRAGGDKVPVELAATACGIVQAVYRREGEWLQAGDPVLAIAGTAAPESSPESLRGTSTSVLVGSHSEQQPPNASSFNH